MLNSYMRSWLKVKPLIEPVQLLQGFKPKSIHHRPASVLDIKKKFRLGSGLVKEPKKKQQKKLYGLAG